MHRGWLLRLCLGIGAGPLGCATGTIEVEQSRLGSVHVAVLSVAPWERYVDALQVQFELNARQAFEQVVPVSQRLEERMLETGRLGLTAGISRREDASGHDMLVGPPETKPKGDPAVTGASGEKPADVTQGGIGTDPMTRYRAATALYQEVQLLNRYVRHAAVRSGYRPYVARLQVTLMPRHRAVPCDVYANLTFGTGPYWAAYPQNSEMTSERASVPTEMTSVLAADKVPRNAAKAVYRAARDPQVVPLMVTDNLEATAHAMSHERLRQFALDLTLLLNRVGVGGGVEALQGHLTRNLGQDLHSVHTVGRLNDNTVRLRLGATPRVETQADDTPYYMVARSHCLTVLLMVPDELLSANVPHTVRAYCRIDWVDAVKGRPVKVTPMSSAGGELAHQVTDILALYGIRPVLKTTQDRELVGWLLGYVQDGDRRRFRDVLHQLMQRGGTDLKYEEFTYEDGLWSRLAQLDVGKTFAQVEFDVPRPPEPAKFPVQLALLEDDGEAAVATLKGADGLVQPDLTAELKDDKSGAPIQPQKVEVLADGTAARFIFPSLVKWDLLRDRSYKLRVSGRPETKDKPDEYAVHVRITKKSVACGFEVRVGARRVVPNKEGKGTLKLVFKRTKESPADGGVYDVEGADCEPRTGKFEFAKDKDVVEVELKLSNLHAQTSVVVHAKNGDLAHEDVRLEVTTPSP